MKMRVGNIIKYDKWYGIVTATTGKHLKEGTDVMVRWNGQKNCSREPVDLLEVISEGR